SLTPQLEARFRSAFPGTTVAVMHSGLEDTARTDAWLAAVRGEARIILGTRLAVLAPLPGLELVVVDEEHDPSFKQQDGLRYSGRDVAVMRAKLVGCPVILGSATPSLESWHHCDTRRYARLDLPLRAAPGSQLPTVRVLDLSRETLDHGFAKPLLDAIALRLARGEQSLIFINRRGYAPVLACPACGWAAGCERCTGHLVLHAVDRRLRCHHCGAESGIPRACPTCGNVDLKPLGRGTQRVEELLTTRFPGARIVRIDRDSARRRKTLIDTLEGIRRGEHDILVGTQLLAKGHDFPGLSLVGVLNADSALFSTDYRAAERLYATLAQVAGRAGRREQRGEVLVQSRFGAHPLFRALVAHDFSGFAAAQLEERRAAGFPPFAYEAVLRAEAAELKTALEFLALASTLVAPPDGVELYDPVPHVITRRAGLERARLLAQSPSRAALQGFLTAWNAAILAVAPRNVRWHLEVDPIEFD
ncbi:MAG: primosomal protein N', partial [Proteobacteria bacterium]|nr:primosomal protein N' [Pseudomonadota bacterium]